MSNAKICDLKSCGKVIKSGPYRTVTIEYKTYDFCEGCFEHFMEFISKNLEKGKNIPQSKPGPLTIPGYPYGDKITLTPCIGTQQLNSDDIKWDGVTTVYNANEDSPAGASNLELNVDDVSFLSGAEYPDEGVGYIEDLDLLINDKNGKLWKLENCCFSERKYI